MKIVTEGCHSFLQNFLVLVERCLSVLAYVFPEALFQYLKGAVEEDESMGRAYGLDINETMLIISRVARGKILKLNLTSLALDFGRNVDSG